MDSRSEKIDITVCHSHQQRCGVKEYGLALDKSLARHGAIVHPCSYENFGDGVGAAAPNSVLLVHYEPSLVTPWFLSTYLRVAKDKGIKTVLCCHLYEHSHTFAGLVDRYVLHRSYPMRHPESTIIPLGCPVYEPSTDREALRSAYPSGSTVLTTIGFLTQWKRLPEIATALLAAMRPHPQLFLHMHTPKPYYTDAIVLGEEERLQRIFQGQPNVRFSTEFLQDIRTLDLAYAADVGFLYHPINTQSVSAATKQFVAARRPLVVTSSTHAWDLKKGVEVVDGFDVWMFAHKIVSLALDTEKRAALEKSMQLEYERLNMDTVAKQYIDLFRSL
jgi:hypothetical protein